MGDYLVSDIMPVTAIPERKTLSSVISEIIKGMKPSEVFIVTADIKKSNSIRTVVSLCGVRSGMKMKVRKIDNGFAVIRVS